MFKWKSVALGLAFSLMILCASCASDSKAKLVVNLYSVQAGNTLIIEVTDYQTGVEVDTFTLDNPGATEQSHEFDLGDLEKPVKVEVSNILGDDIMQFGFEITGVDGKPIILEGGENITVDITMQVPIVEH